MLDVSIRFDILNLLARLYEPRPLASSTPRHDTASVRYPCDDAQRGKAPSLTIDPPL